MLEVIFFWHCIQPHACVFTIQPHAVSETQGFGYSHTIAIFWRKIAIYNEIIRIMVMI